MGSDERPSIAFCSAASATCVTCPSSIAPSSTPPRVQSCLPSPASAPVTRSPSTCASTETQRGSSATCLTVALGSIGVEATTHSNARAIVADLITALTRGWDADKESECGLREVSVEMDDSLRYEPARRMEQ